MDEQPESKWVEVTAIAFNLFASVAVFAGFGLIVLLFWRGIEWYLEVAYPTLSVILAFPVMLLLPIGLSLALFRRTRSFGGFCLVLTAYIYFCSMWMQALGLAYLYAGPVWMVIGYIFAGVGVFFVAIIGGLLHGHWENVGSIAISLLLTGVVYMVGAALVGSGENKESGEWQ